MGAASTSVAGRATRPRLSKGPQHARELRAGAKKVVAGFKAAVLEAGSADALVKWLKDNDYAYSPQIEAWAKPYIEAKYKFTALKVHKDKGREREDRGGGAWRLLDDLQKLRSGRCSPLPRAGVQLLQQAQYRWALANACCGSYFLADARYQGEFDQGKGRVDHAARPSGRTSYLPNSARRCWRCSSYRKPRVRRNGS